MNAVINKIRPSGKKFVIILVLIAIFLGRVLCLQQICST